jgi:2-iminobutanoate/2-iminopropanoate deaminase
VGCPGAPGGVGAVSGLRPVNPAQIAPPVGAYSQAMLSPGGGRWLHVAGQVGLHPDGTLAEGFAAQAEAVWRNIGAILAAAGMGPQDLVKVTTFLTDPDHLPLFAPIRARHLGDARPASTLVVVRALARPDWLVEVEAVAWRGGDDQP